MSVTGVGGLFFRSENPKSLAAWYLEHLGVGGKYGQWTQAAGTTVFAPFDAGTDYFPANKAWMLNLRVEDIDSLIARLRTSGIEVTVKAEWDSEETGRFARIHDPEGNPIELWQPPAD